MKEALEVIKFARGKDQPTNNEPSALDILKVK